MYVPYENRSQAGRALAFELREYQGRPDVIVLALPRGGVPVAYEIAAALGAPLELILVRKLRVRGQEGLAMGAIAAGGVEVLNDNVVAELGISQSAIDAAVREERYELERQALAYGAGRVAPLLAGKTVILVDDGLATGATMHAAVLAAGSSRRGEWWWRFLLHRRRPLRGSKRSPTTSLPWCSPSRFTPSGATTDSFRKSGTRRSVACSSKAGQ